MTIILKEHPFNISAQRLSGSNPGQSLESYINTLVATVGVPLSKYTAYVGNTYPGGVTATVTNVFTSPAVTAVAGQGMRVRTQGAVKLNSTNTSLDAIKLILRVNVGGTSYNFAIPIATTVLAANVPFTLDALLQTSAFSQSTPSVCSGLLCTPTVVVGTVANAVGALNQYPGYNSGNWGAVVYSVDTSALGTNSQIILDTCNIDVTNR